MTGFRPYDPNSSGGNSEDKLDKITLTPQTVAGEVEFLSDITVPTGSVILGKDGARLSSVGRGFLFTDAREQMTLYPEYHFDEFGSERPHYWEVGSLIPDAPAAGDEDGTIISVAEYQFLGAGGNSMTTAFTVNPSENGTLRVQSWEGMDDTGAVLVDTTFEISGVQTTSTLIKIVLPAPVITESGDNQFIRLSGVPLYGAVQSTGIFTGELKAQLFSDVHLLTEKEVANLDDLAGSLGYVFTSWGANLQNAGRFPAINGTADGAEVPSLGISSSAQIPADGTIDVLTYYSATGDNTTVFEIIKNGAVAHTFTCDATYGRETGIGVSVAVGDNVALRYAAGTKPASGIYSMYIN